RELAEVQRRLDWSPRDLHSQRLEGDGPGNAVVLAVESKAVTTVASAIGSRGVRAERVAQRACERLAVVLDHDVPVDEHTADQLLIPIALAGGGSFTTVAPTLHTRTNAAVIERFLPMKIGLEDQGRGRWRVYADAVAPARQSCGTL
ncbi:MAG: RNA 3'-terminal phosphate cyclase, partial [Myxococcota bacterium]